MSVYVPADLDLPDRILFNLTGRQVAILAPAALALWGIWQALAGEVHPVFLIALSAPVAAAAFALAMIRRDGTSLDRLVWAALRTPRAPLAAGSPAPSAGKAAAALTGRRARRTSVRPAPVPVDGVDKAGVIDLGPAGAAIALDAGCVNFDLRSGAEQGALCDAFARLLHTLEGHLQVCVNHRPIDLTGYLAGLDTRAAELSEGPLRDAARAHRAWLASLTAGHDLLAREITVVVTGPDAEAASLAAAQVEAFFAQIETTCRRLDRAALAERIRYGLDPYGTATPAFGSWSQ
ncbi:PrgI family protein [Glycomyces sp. MUSA5-2]|uniref:PrgI family protein n=1 Tax=Glycomyces sp. MUSA5-2 TaxID=2053002 RepID=UPI00300AF0A8